MAHDPGVFVACSQACIDAAAEEVMQPQRGVDMSRQPQGWGTHVAESEGVTAGHVML